MEQTTLTTFDKMYNVIDDVFIQSDSRTNTWFLVTSFWPVAYILTGYLMLVYLGPKIMENRKPFVLKNTILAYNVFQVVALLAFIIETVRIVLNEQLSLLCEDMAKIPETVMNRILILAYVFYFSKIVDLFDTVFFILKKKNNQLTVLHVFHHSTMVINTWIGMRHVLINAAALPCLINAGVHVIMYSYYFLAAMGPEVQKYLWWKRYLTQLQLVQFVFAIVHGIRTLRNNCPVPLGLAIYGMSYVFFILLLFLNFYFQTYYVKRDTAAMSKYDVQKTISSDVKNLQDAKRSTVNSDKFKSL